MGHPPAAGEHGARRVRSVVVRTTSSTTASRAAALLFFTLSAPRGRWRRAIFCLCMDAPPQPRSVWSPCGSSHIGPRLYLGIAGRPGPQARRAVSGPTAGRGLQFALSLSLSLSPQRPADLLGRLLPINRPPGSPNPYPARARTVDRPRSIERQSGVVNRGGASEFGDGGRARQINRRGGSTAGVAGRPYLNVIILKIIAHFSLTPRPPPPPSMHRRRPLGHSGPRERQQQGAGGGDRVLWADRGMETLGGR